MNTKTEPKNTPGPWSLASVTGNGGDVTHLVPIDSEKQSILTVVDTDEAVFAAVYSDSDARLIAAAPDLLDALVTLQRDGNDFAEWHPRFNGAIAKVRAAIAKAKGAD